MSMPYVIIPEHYLLGCWNALRNAMTEKRWIPQYHEYFGKNKTKTLVIDKITRWVCFNAIIHAYFPVTVTSSEFQFLFKFFSTVKRAT